MAKIYREDAEQKALIQWADMTRFPTAPASGGDKIGDHLFAIPNGGWRGRIEAARLKGLGVRAGVSDLFLAFPVGKFAGFFIEMKAQEPHDSRVSGPQAAFLGLMASVGYGVTVCRGWDIAKDDIQVYLAGQWRH